MRSLPNMTALETGEATDAKSVRGASKEYLVREYGLDAISLVRAFDRGTGSIRSWGCP